MRPDLPILLVTGFSESVNRESAAALGIRGTLQKPFGPAELVRALEATLADPPGQAPH